MSKNIHRVRLILFALVVFSAFWSLSTTSQAGFFDQKTAGFGSSANTDFLPVEEAFRLEARLKGSTLILRWNIEPEHYLYRSRFRVNSVEPNDATLIPVDIPRGEKINDAFQGNVEILRDHVELSYSIELPAESLQQGMVVSVTFQGCAEAGLCYPPHIQQLNLVQN